MYSDQQVIDLCATGLVNDLNSFIQSGGNIHRSFKRNNEPATTTNLFIIACRHNQLNILKILIENDYEYASTIDYSFQTACLYGNKQVIQFLLDLNLDSYCRYYGLQNACVFGDLEIVKLIISYDTNVNLNPHNLLLSYAASNGHLDIVKYLVSVGAKIHHGHDHCFKCSVYFASLYGHFHIFKYLLPLCSFDHLHDPQTFNSSNVSITLYLYSHHNKNMWFFSSILWKSEEFECFYTLMYKFYYEQNWIVSDIDIKMDNLWDGNIGLIVSSFLW